MNVIVIVSDTLRKDFLGCYGNKWIHTPYIDRFSKEAIVLDRAKTGSFPTVPCRNDIMTGRWSFAYKQWSPLGENETVLSECLNEAGYVTACFVDCPNAFQPGYNYQRGFQAWDFIRGQEIDTWKTASKPVDLPCDPSKLRFGGEWAQRYLKNVAWRRSEEDYFPARTMKAASRWIEQNIGNPFFLYVDTFDPHEPWDPPRHYLARYEPDGYEGDEVIYPKYDKWDTFLTKEELIHCRNLYAGEVSLVDRWIGYLLERVQDFGILDDTVVIITADHGFFLGEHGHIGKAVLTKDKYQSLPLYPEVSDIPFIIRLPNGRGARRSTALAQHADIMPTILDTLGLSIPKSVEGTSLKPVFTGKDEIRSVAVSAPTFSSPEIEIPHPTTRISVTDGQWMFIFGSQVDPGEPELTRMVDSRQRTIAVLYGPIEAELYDLSADPGCTKNVLAQNKDVARTLHAGLLEFLEKTSLKDEHRNFFEKPSDEML